MVNYYRLLLKIGFSAFHHPKACAALQTEAASKGIRKKCGDARPASFT